VTRPQVRETAIASRATLSKPRATAPTLAGSRELARARTGEPPPPKSREANEANGEANEANLTAAAPRRAAQDVARPWRSTEGQGPRGDHDEHAADMAAMGAQARSHRMTDLPSTGERLGWSTGLRAASRVPSRRLISREGRAGALGEGRR
jgi:hypothetical protein